MAGLGYLMSSGKLTAENLRTVADIFSEQPEAAEEALEAEAGLKEKKLLAVDAPRPGTTEEEIARRNLERLSLVADHRLKLANRQMVEVNRRSEEVEQQRVVETEQREAEAEQLADQAFKKDLEIVSLLKPKVAMDSLLARPMDDAARMLMAMEARKGKRIFEAARKDPGNWAKMLAIQRRLRELSSDAQTSDEMTGTK